MDEVRNDMSNDSEGEIVSGPGNHAIVVRSIDDYGRISYSPSDMSAPLTIKVAPSPWKPVWLVLSLFALLVVVLLLFYARLHRMWRARTEGSETVGAPFHPAVRSPWNPPLPKGDCRGIGFQRGWNRAAQ